jgi:hypothetical protein
MINQPHLLLCWLEINHMKGYKCAFILETTSMGANKYQLENFFSLLFCLYTTDVAVVYRGIASQLHDNSLVAYLQYGCTGVHQQFKSGSP